MNASDSAFGFGKDVEGGGQTPTMSVVSDEGLVKALKDLGDSDGPTVIGLKPGSYSFTKKEISIRARRLTLRPEPGSSVPIILQNASLKLDLERADDILIQDLFFYSDGEIGHPKDGILLDGDQGSRDSRSRVRITHCYFDGYRDMAIESRSHQSRLLATIDHCLFYDRNPGKGDFFNRGALNIASAIDESGDTPPPGQEKPRKEGNSFVTVAFNVFVDIWRRSPRVGFPGNFGHVFNNLVYRWGFNNETNDTWRGMPVGNGGEALIEANRFIPWKEKLERAIQADDPERVDIGSGELLNEFDKAEGTQDRAVVPTGTFASFNAKKIYKLQGIANPDVSPTNTANLWQDIVRAAGPRGFAPPVSSVAKQRVLNALRDTSA
jgi:hypothetical protein